MMYLLRHLSLLAHLELKQAYRIVLSMREIAETGQIIAVIGTPLIFSPRRFYS